VTTTTGKLDQREVQRKVLHAEWPVPDAATRRALWVDQVGATLADADLDLVAHRYELGAGGIASATRAAQLRADHRVDAGPTLTELVAGVQDTIIELLGDLAKRVEVTQDWSELVLTPDTLDDVKMLIGRIRNSHAVLDGWGFRKKLARGSGVAALFSGPPGTGKTMVAGLIARELQLELYQVDLSRIVSKWIGETEKQLAKVFEAAEAGHALILFDEADALFAKRSADVKSAVDRYANLEVNYLLQRVESFGGVVILTTNLDTSIDPALRRRLASHIVFGTPELEERSKLWRAMLDTGAPLEANLDLPALAEEFAERQAQTFGTRRWRLHSSLPTKDVRLALRTCGELREASIARWVAC
jgi:Cdc6-like AAA superfamily ATPase